MARIVMKFGGTSMAGTERIRNVAARVKHEVDAGNEVAVVVSAMAGETDRLVNFCREAAPLHDPTEYDVVVAAGEQVTSGLLAITLQAMGVKARSWLGWQYQGHRWRQGLSRRLERRRNFQRNQGKEQPQGCYLAIAGEKTCSTNDQCLDRDETPTRSGATSR